MSKEQILTNTEIEESETTSYDIEKCDFVFNYDSNGQNYASNQLRYRLEHLANASYFTDFSAGLIMMNHIIELKNSSATSGIKLLDTTDTGVHSDFLLTLKTSALSMINSTLTKFNDIQLNDSVPYIDKYANFELLQMSQDDLVSMAELMQYAKDDGFSLGYSTSNTKNAPKNMEFNNVIQTGTQDLSAGYSPKGFLSAANKGLLKRLQMTSFNGTRATSYYAIGTNNSDSSTVDGKWINNVNYDTANSLKVYVYSVIPLSFINPVFKVMPLCRGVKLYLDVNVNTNYQSTITTDNTGVITSFSGSSSNGSGTCPYMLSSLDGVQILNTAASVTNTFTINNYISSSQNTALYLPQVHLNLEYENEYTKDSVKKVKYIDYNIYSSVQGLIGISAGDAKNNVLITTSVIRPRRLILIPRLNSASNGGVLPESTPFTSSPYTTLKTFSLTNVNAYVNGKQLIQSNQIRNFQNYQELMNTLSINGGGFKSDLGHSSGLISKSDFDNAGYGIVVLDLVQVKNSVEDNLGKSIHVSLTNQSGTTIDVVCIVEFEREFDINVSTGQLNKIL